MLAFLTLAFSALLITLGITPVCRSVSRHFGWVDHPAGRKVHMVPVPRTGGIAIVFGYAVALSLVFWPLKGSPVMLAALPKIQALLPAVFVVFCTGLLDDIVGLKPWMKIVGEVIAGGLACGAGVQIRSVAAIPVANVWLSVGITICWLAVCTNAFNLIDGLDGLAAGVGVVATATAFLSGLLNGSGRLAISTAPLLGALLGFLPYNLNPASIFMGDCGSLTVGFLLGCFGVIWFQKSVTLLGMTAPLIALSIPLLDTALAIVRRFLREQPIFGADRGHIHHRLLARGLTVRRVTYLLYTFSGVGAGLSLLLSTNFGHLGGVVLVMFCVIVGLAIHHLRYEEFDTIGRLLFGGMFRRVLSANLSIRQLEQDLHAARSLEECWKVLLAAIRDAGFSEAALHFRTYDFTTRFSERDPLQCWVLRIPLNGSSHIDLSVPFGAAPIPSTLSRLAVSLRSVFAAKLEAFPAADSQTVDASLAALAAAVDTAEAAPKGPFPLLDRLETSAIS
jgi:UDP-GlcNAc:undecaprenyl-phosphate GlcNAc-1-phosphate transferase